MFLTKSNYLISLIGLSLLEDATEDIRTRLIDLAPFLIKKGRESLDGFAIQPVICKLPQVSSAHQVGQRLVCD